MHRDPTHNRRLVGLVAFFFLLLAVQGCSGGGMASVSGKVTYKGKEVTEGTILFAPIPGKDETNPGKPATGKVEASGTYVMGTNSAGDGVRIGRHQVSYSAPVLEVPQGKELKPGESPPLSRFAGLVPKQTEVEVKSGSNTIDIELVSPQGK